MPLDKGDIVRDWRTNLAKYSKFPGIRRFCICPVSQIVLAKTRGMCFKGSLENAKIHVCKNFSPEQDVIPLVDKTYLNTNRLREIKPTKRSHLEQMMKFLWKDRTLVCCIELYLSL